MECIICLNDLKDDNFFILECCNQPIHIQCLKDWINTNYNKNSDISLCIYCKKQNNIINDLICNIKNENILIINDIENQLNNNIINNNYNNINSESNNNINFFTTLLYEIISCIIIIFIAGILIIMFL